MGGAALGFCEHIVQRCLKVARDIPVTAEREPLLAEAVVLAIGAVMAALVIIPFI